MNPTDLLDRYPSTLANSVHDAPATTPFNRVVSQPEPGVTMVEPMKLPRFNTLKQGAAVLPALLWNPTLPGGNQSAKLSPQQSDALTVWLSAQANGLPVDNLLMLWTDGSGGLFAHYSVISADLVAPVRVVSLRPGIRVTAFGPFTLTLCHDFSFTPRRDWPVWVNLPTKP